ncbi:P-loop NTPase fold protein [Oceanobacter sp. 3_MG-2023]|uniref:KAP family P-loop NTPase fold protein n=1 Tax=Oceanobacter sp. 3_MG-2023 TaxID=3062622 RepID=UPI0027375201|nr:P-loop NTPase fold protein [Oceanobacter sp. 3_MG-2023]MDP2504466.1 P-loop NTPase fold protein [Oceanobacter sp. 3_MG-2023]
MSEQEDLTFEFRDDFKRVGIADKVITLLTTPIGISPMVIDGDWGTGKTEFCQKLIHKFRSEHGRYRLVYVDAFQADHADDPLMTVLAAVAGEALEGEAKRTFLQKAIPVVRYGLQTAFKASVSHVLKENADDIADGLEKHLQDSANKAIDASVAAVLKDHEKAQQNLKALQATLADQVTADSPIVIFIDELDRCRPDFAVQMLEVIKHTFDVVNVKFVLVTNTKQLRAAINHRYGPLVDAQRYLDKFLKFSVRLPADVSGRVGYGYGENRLLASVKHYSNLVSSSGILAGTGLGQTDKEYFTFASELIQVNQLSLRQVETFTRYLEVYHSLSRGLAPDETAGLRLLRLFGVFVSCFSPDVYDNIQSGCTNADVIAPLLGVPTLLPDNEETYHYSRKLAVIIGLQLVQNSAFNAEHFMFESEDSQECWKKGFDYYFGNRSVLSDIWQPVKEVFSVLSLSSR